MKCFITVCFGEKTVITQTISTEQHEPEESVLYAPTHVHTCTHTPHT